MRKKIYLIRHATPDPSRKDLIYYLPPGPSLSGQGLDEAHRLGLYLNQFRFVRVYSSPLERALHTAQIVTEITGAQLQVDERLMEWQPGETFETIRERLWPVFQLAVQDCQDGVIVGLVSHGGPIGALLRCLGMEKETLVQKQIFDSGNALPPAGAWLASYEEENSSWQLKLDFTPQTDYEQIPI